MMNTKIVDEKHVPQAKFLIKTQILQSNKMRRRPDFLTNV